MLVLELKSVSKRYGATVAVAPVDLELREDRTYVLIGPSGCGKSTLMKLMLGLIEPDSGSVFVEGEKLSGANVMPLRRKVGYVVQHGGLFPHLTARENISLVARYLGWQADRIEHRFRELAELTHFPFDALSRYPLQLSGGQRQRVSLMRALMLDPDVLLLDEPLGALDPIIRSELQCDLRDVFRSLKKTVVMVTHDLNEAAYFADEVLLLREGRVVQRGSVDDLLNAPADPFVTRFVNAQRTVLPGGA
jgi:osmoprotectant transport system ATP-binding protein